MTNLINELWDSLKNEVAYYQQKDKKLLFNDSKKNDFDKEFRTLYDSIKYEYMSKNVKSLDRHKVAATMIVAMLNTNIISYTKISDNKVFVGSEMIATEIALSWMRQKLNKKLIELGYVIDIKKYFMPAAFSCPTPYFDIFSRNLYFARTNYCLNPLDIAEKLFLLEYITLLKNDIDPESLVE